MALEIISEHKCFGGRQLFCRHDATEIGLPMRFALFSPPRPSNSMLIFLAGLTCTEETATIKAGAQRVAAAFGITLLMPDTSPRGADVPGESDDWEFGVSAGFYLDAIQSPWSKHWRMESYLIRELLPLVSAEFSIDESQVSICGHSMGGHGALTLALRYPGRFASVSAFAPIAAPTRAPWGQKAFTGYLGDDRSVWAAYDASELMAQRHEAPYPRGILIDQGAADKFLAEQLHPHLFEAACRKAGQPLTLRVHEGYDHSYYFISTFIEDHLRFHHESVNTQSLTSALAT
jgi:S-formylglutathione hydrolase